MLKDIIATLSTIRVMGVSLMEIISIGAQAAMILGGTVPFIPQYLDVLRTRNTEGFSLFVCLNLLIAHILRIMFWFGERFELPLLAQSVLMILSMLILVELCVRVNTKNELVASRQRRFMGSSSCSSSPAVYKEQLRSGLQPIRRGTGGPESAPSSQFQSHSFLEFDLQYFWKWTDFLSYVEFTLTFTLLVGFVTYVLLDVSPFVQFLGFMAVFMEAMLGMPQFYRNFRNKCTVGMSRKMVAMWTCGDVFKTGYFIARAAPMQFWICGMLQIGIDISIFIQVHLYRGNAAPVVIKASKPALS